MFDLSLSHLFFKKLNLIVRLNFFTIWENLICTDDIDGVDIILVPSEEYEKKPIYKRPRSPLVKDDDSDSDFTVSDDSDDDKG